MAIATNSDTRRLAQVLLRRGLVDMGAMEEAVRKQGADGSFLEVLVRQGSLDAVEAAKSLAEAYNLQYVDLDRTQLDERVGQLLPLELCMECLALPLRRRGGTIDVAMANPLNMTLVEKVRGALRKDIEPFVAEKASIISAIERQSRRQKADDPEGGESGAPAVFFVDELIKDGVAKRATDIHLEPNDGYVLVRYRIDGVLYEQDRPDLELYAAIVSRIKIMASMDIGERRLPQSGRIQRTLNGNQYDLRISTLPTIHSENVVIRVLSMASGLLDLKALGIPDRDHQLLSELIVRPNGIVLVTGPTGSGKSTTLYAALNTINSMEINIHTIEDPVEYQLDLIRQTQINPKADLTFGRILREILRQDPDVIMVGEIRDVETAEVAIHASLTGHLVFSTLHTNSAAGAITRLDNMEIEPFLVASSLIGVVAQRLCRTLCPACRIQDDKATEWVSARETRFANMDFTAYRQKGCAECNQTGYSGRRGIFELLLMDEDIQAMAIARKSATEIENRAILKGMTPLWQSGLDAVVKGTTTLAEVMRVAH